MKVEVKPVVPDSLQSGLSTCCKKGVSTLILIKNIETKLPIRKNIQKDILESSAYINTQTSYYTVTSVNNKHVTCRGRSL